jgi:hypothetical protein
VKIVEVGFGPSLELLREIKKAEGEHSAGLCPGGGEPPSAKELNLPIAGLA